MRARRIIRFLATAAVALTAFLLPTSAASASMDAAPLLTHRQLDVDDFSYASWDARYELSLDADGRARMHVTETLAAQFPDFDQNRGIVRGLTLSYRGASSETRVLSVTDENGAAVPYETEEDDGLVYILTGTDDFVHGLTTYVIEYEMRDVILAADSGVDEFYWDLLPLDSTQPVQAFRAEIVFDSSMSENLTGSTSCYSGEYRAEGTCVLQGPERDGRSAVFTVSSGARPAGDGITVAVGLEPGTAAQPDARLPNPAADVAPIVLGTGAIALSGAGWATIAAFKRARRRATGIIIAQYEVPDALPPLIAASLIPGAKDAISAEIVHLAVRGALRIEDAGDGVQPSLRRIPGWRAADPLDAETLDALFQDADADGVMALPEADETFAARMQGLEHRGPAEAAERGLTTLARSRGAMLVQWLSLAAVIVGLGLSIWGTVSGRESALPGLIIASVAGVVVMVSTAIAFTKHVVLTPQGAAAHEHLLGVKEFIRVAEADRIRMLQSYRGAERRADGGVDVILLYERLLPYAMLFGQEREWAGVLEVAYREHQRSAGWLSDTSGGYFAARMAMFSAATHTSATYSAPTAASSSSSGGSFGGGFSGGGGGGGFSGGR